MSRIRLVCPNCGAQYEVPVDVIPDGGRDVQCSSCGHTWFQRHPEDGPDLADQLSHPLLGDDFDTDAASHMPPPAPAYDDEDDDEDEDDFAPSPEMQQQRARNLDPGMADLFRQEREFEARRRAAENVETQPELGLSAPDEDEQARRARQSREHMARMRGDEPSMTRPATPRPPPIVAPPEQGRSAAQVAVAAAAGSRRDLLPDVEEINQTLRASSEPRVVDSARGRSFPETAPRERGSSFARGFFLTVLLAIILVAVYAQADQIAAKVPALAPVLESYVEAVDSARLWLDQQITPLLASLDGMAPEAGAPPAAAAPAD